MGGSYRRPPGGEPPASTTTTVPTGHRSISAMCLTAETSNPLARRAAAKFLRHSASGYRKRMGGRLRKLTRLAYVSNDAGSATEHRMPLAQVAGSLRA